MSRAEVGVHRHAARRQGACEQKERTGVEASTWLSLGKPEEAFWTSIYIHKMITIT